MDRARLAAFLRTRRQALQPEDVGLPRGIRRRRTGGLRREEVAALSGMSADYYSRIEQQRGPQPSQQLLAAVARGLRLNPDERDHLLRLGGYPPRQRDLSTDQVNPGMQRILDGLDGAAAQVVSSLGETLCQTPLAVALLGDQTAYTGLDRSLHHRWFTTPESRQLHPADDHPTLSRQLVADLHRAYTADAPGARSHAMVGALLASSAEFAALWQEHPVAGTYCAPKRIRHPRVGLLELHCQILVDPDRTQSLLVYTAVPGSPSRRKLDELAGRAS
ncbi:DNA-binding protein [Catellatospora sp. TT07R-123]|uniref:helix-turn-helix transcriptional regulator n=1 Tax=Catellatospora sp. TT07R-123 TaxID=2733863 RepID=UPI001B135B67|nr:helix-turn-helix transcriptional regulator [Catellatospora sp. TT07R-123]GHJ47607.1 DNA-binding protein [Catellatospora sp. TT07R-123]